jgi:hypothetical protein
MPMGIDFVVRVKVVKVFMNITKALIAVTVLIKVVRVFI